MSAPTQPPEYKGEPLDGERGPGLGCFWIQIALLTFFLIFTPLTVMWAWDPAISAVLLIITLILLLFSGQTIIFLLRLVAADRRSRRAPLDPKANPTVGQMEDVGDSSAATPEPGETQAATAEPGEAGPRAATPEPGEAGPRAEVSAADTRAATTGAGSDAQPPAPASEAHPADKPDV